MLGSKKKVYCLRKEPTAIGGSGKIEQSLFKCSENN